MESGKILTHFLLLCVLAGCDLRREPPTRSIDEAIEETIGISPETRRVPWDDGSGGEPEKVAVLCGNDLHLFVRDAAGWRRAGSVDASELHLATNRRFPPDDVIFSVHGGGCLVCCKAPGLGSVGAYVLTEEGPVLGHIPNEGTGSVPFLAKRLKEWLDRNYAGDSHAAVAQNTAKELIR